VKTCASNELPSTTELKKPLPREPVRRLSRRVPHANQHRLQELDRSLAGRNYPHAAILSERPGCLLVSLPVITENAPIKSGWQVISLESGPPLMSNQSSQSCCGRLARQSNDGVRSIFARWVDAIHAEPKRYHVTRERAI
jgi:hypothetical protein